MKPDAQVEQELQKAEDEIRAVCNKYGLKLTDSIGCFALELTSEQQHPNGDWHVLSMAFEAQ
jgi:hypothetical protein